MVRLTLDLIARGTSGYTKKKRDEGMQHYLRRLTHLYLEDRSIDEVGDDLRSCKSLVVLYLYDNKLTRVPNLCQNASLTHLYLQNNQISKMEWLSGLHNLTKLYIGGNHITVLEGLEKSTNLQELHIENQRLPPGESLLFEPRSLNGIARTLQVINVSGNFLNSVADLGAVVNITQFMAADNNLNDMREMARLLQCWPALWRVELTGNPLCHKVKYRDRIIVMAPALEVLDGKDITDTARQFLKNWKANKDAIKRRKEFLSRENTDVKGEEGDRHSQVSASSSYIMPGLPRKQFEKVLARSASLPSTTAEHTLPNRMFSDVTAPRRGYGHVRHQHGGVAAPYRLALVSMTPSIPGDR